MHINKAAPTYYNMTNLKTQRNLKEPNECLITYFTKLITMANLAIVPIS